MQPPINRLSYDVLHLIFSTYTHEPDGDPIKLTHVCRVWRDIIRNTGAFWTKINLQVPARARHNVELAQTSPLDVLWFNQNYTPGVLRSVDDVDVAWVWPHASRFAEFILSHSQHIVDSVFRKLPQQLPKLVNLVVLCQSVQPDVVPTRISQSMPYLRHVQISYMKLYAEDLVRVFRESSSLQKIELMHPYIVLPADGTAQERGSITLPYLRVFSITDVVTTVQRYLMDPLVFPPECTITVARSSQNFQTNPVLDPTILSRFRPHQFEELECHEDLLNISEYVHGNRACLRLVSTHEGVNYQSVDSSLGLSHIHTLTISGSMSAQSLETLFQYTSSVTTIVIRKTRTAQLIFPRITPVLAAHQDVLPDLQALELGGIHFDAAILTSVEELLQHCRDVGREIQTLVLQKCRFDADGDTLPRLGELVAEIRVA